MNRSKARFMLALMVVCLIGGIGSVIIGVQNFVLAGKTKSQPQVLTAAQLIRQGPGDNQYVRIDNAELRSDGFVTQTREGEAEWENVYIPLSSANDSSAASDDAPQIILISDSTKNKAAVEALAKESSFQGVLGTWDATLDDKTRDLLREHYPKMDPAKCYLLSYNATPPSRSGSYACMGIGVALLVVMTLLGIKARRNKWGQYLAPQQRSTFGVAPLAPAPSTTLPLPPISSTPPGQPPQMGNPPG